MENKKNPFSLQIDVSDFLPAEDNEKQSMVAMRESVSFWDDGFRRLRKNTLAMISLAVIIVVMIFAFVAPIFYPYSYEEQIRDSENLGLMEYSQTELALKAEGESVFPHILGTDSLGRDTMVRIMKNLSSQSSFYLLV
jgi:oligopeptide transport system permease protein